jgi:hypothetical protein
MSEKKQCINCNRGIDVAAKSCLYCNWWQAERPAAKPEQAATTAAAAPPRAGVLDPGRSLGGLRLGATPAQVRAAWGSAYGVCRGCRVRTWYFTYERFKPQGAGVEFRGGRVSALFTLWSPPGWRTTKGLRIGDPVARVTLLYGPLTRTECGAYYALTLPGRGTTAFYVVGEKVWGLGLIRPGRSPCR